MIYPGLFNSSYQPSPGEILAITHPTDFVGPSLIGEILVSVLQGILFMQYLRYVKNFWNEKRWTRFLIHGDFILCTLKFAYVWWITWDKYVSNFGNWLILADISPLTVPIGISSTIPSAVAQTFYIQRCWALSHNWFFLIPATLTLIVTVGSGISLTIGAAFAAGGNFGPGGSTFKMIVTSANVSLASGLGCDVLITTFTCYYLLREKTGFKQTDSLVWRLIKCSIESAAGPTIVALINLILNQQSASNQWFIVPNLILAHVYGCSLMYSVNARRDVCQKMTSLVTGGGSGVRGNAGEDLGPKSRMSFAGARSPTTTTGFTSTGIFGMLRSKSTNRHNNEYQTYGRSYLPPAQSVLVEVQTITLEDDYVGTVPANTSEKDGESSNGSFREANSNSSRVAFMGV